MAKTVTVELTTPIAGADGAETTQLTLREPLLEDYLEAERTTQSGGEHEAFLLGIISGLGYAKIKKVSMRDHQKLLVPALANFLALTPPSSDAQ